MAGEARRGSFLPLMDLHNDQPLHFPKTQALRIAVPGTLGAQLQTPHHRASPCERYSPSKRTRLLCSRSACIQASGGEHTAPSPPPVCRARGWGCREPHVGEPGALRVCSVLWPSRGRCGQEPSHHWLGWRVIPTRAFFPRTFLIRMDLTVKKASGHQR